MDSVRSGPYGQIFRPDNFVFGQVSTSSHSSPPGLAHACMLSAHPVPCIVGHMEVAAHVTQLCKSASLLTHLPDHVERTSTGSCSMCHVRTSALY